MNPDHVLLALGIVLLLGALALVVAGKAVTSGHALMMFAGVLLVGLPSVANLELTDKGVKFTRREETFELIDRTKELAANGQAVSTQLTETIEALRAANSRISALETQISQRQSSGNTNSDGGEDAGAKGESPVARGLEDTFFDQLIRKSQQTSNAADMAVDSTLTLEKKFSTQQVKPLGLEMRVTPGSVERR